MKELLTEIDKAIKVEQETQREKTLTPGLVKAKAIIIAYTEKNNFNYQYNITGTIWLDVKDKEQLKKLDELGYLIRRKS